MESALVIRHLKKKEKWRLTIVGQAFPLTAAAEDSVLGYSLARDLTQQGTAVSKPPTAIWRSPFFDVARLFKLRSGTSQVENLRHFPVPA